jgi:hypothetical protein
VHGELDRGVATAMNSRWRRRGALLSPVEGNRGREQAREGAGARGESQLGFSTSKTCGKASSTLVKGLHASRRLWRGRHVVNVGLLEHANPTKTLPFLGLYLLIQTSLTNSSLLNVVELRESYNIA